MAYIVRQIVEKTDDAVIGAPVNIGALSRDVIDLRPKQVDSNGNEIYPADSNATGYTFAQFIDHYLTFMKEVPFIFIGPPDNTEDNTLTNTHIGLWLDTSVRSDTLWDRRTKRRPVA